MSCVPRFEGAAALTQVECEEGVTLLGKVLGEVLLEEVIGEAVHVQNGTACLHRLLLRLVADQCCVHLAFAVRIRSERDRQLLISVTEDVWNPSSHKSQSNRRFECAL